MKLIRLGLLIIFFVLFVPSVSAVSLTFGSFPSSIDQNQEVAVSFTLACDGCSDSYFRGVFYKSGSNYFGLTKNNSGAWIGTSTDKTQYFKMSSEELVASSGSGTLTIKPDIQDPFFEGLGSYMFKMVRYTSGGSTTWADPVAVTITGPSPTPSNTPTPTTTPTNSPQPTSTNTPTPTNKPTNTPTPKITVTQKPTQKYSPTPTERILDSSSVSGQVNNEGEILGAKDEKVTTSSVTPAPASKKPLIITFLFIGIGCALLSIALVLRKQFFA